jgi:hypothetical protein
MGGGGFLADPSSLLDELIVSLSPATRPRVCYIPTPAGDSDRSIAAFFEAFSRLGCELSCVGLFGIPEGPVEHLAPTRRHLRLRREHSQRPCDLAAAWRRSRATGHVRPRRRSRRCQCRRELLVRVQRHGLVRARARPSPRRTRNPVRQLVPALRRRGAASTGLSSARRRRIPGRIRRRRRCRASLRRHGAVGGGRVDAGRSGVSRRARQRDAAGSRFWPRPLETLPGIDARDPGVHVAFERSCR